MKSKLYYCCILLLITTYLSAQLNTTLISNLPYDDHVSDVWGYVGADGTEYALVGALFGTSIVSLADPAAPEEIHFIPGVGTIWRDLKTFGNYAYVTNDGEGGVLIIDLSQLPNSIETTIWQPSIPNETGVVENCHNLYIDESGIIYLAGCNLNGGGVIMADAAANPTEPPVVGLGDARYSHDVYARDGIMYSSEIGLGQLTITDVNDKSNPQLLASQMTPFTFTHHSWLSDDDTVVFTADETGDAPIAAYDISDLEDIVLLNEFRPLATIGQEVIPHNIHVIDDFLAISYYTDGLVIVDANRPSNLVEVGNYDTFNGPSGGFNGAWGAYPYLPSGLILVTDQSTGLYVIQADYQRAAYLEGEVSDMATGNPINDVQVDILTTNTTDNSNAIGEFATGIATSGTYDVRFSKTGYISQTIAINLQQGEVTEQLVQLEALESFAFNGQVRDAVTSEIISDAKITILSKDNTFQAISDGEGNFSFETFFPNTYEVYVGKWGYKSTALTNQEFTSTNNFINVELEVGIEDIFVNDLGWEVSNTNATGIWELAFPPVGLVAPYDDNITLSPIEDVTADSGNSCFVTGNSTDLASGVLSGGIATLRSPSFDLSGYEAPVLSFYHWYAAVDRTDGTPQSSTFIVRINNGIRNTTLETITYPDSASSPGWRYYEYHLNDHVEVTDDMQMIFVARATGEEEIIEAGIDYFQIVEADPTSINDVQFADYQMNVSPNPTNELFQVNYKLPPNSSNSKMNIYNATGQLVQQIPLEVDSHISFGKELQAGLYILQIVIEDAIGAAQKAIKYD